MKQRSVTVGKKGILVWLWALLLVWQSVFWLPVNAAEGQEPLSLPVIFIEQRDITRNKEIKLPSEAEYATLGAPTKGKLTSIFSVNKSMIGSGHVVTIASSNRFQSFYTEYEGNRLALYFSGAKLNLKKSKLQYPGDVALSEIRPNADTGIPNQVGLELHLLPSVRDIVMGIDERGERISVSLITNALFQVSLARQGDEELLTAESFLPVRPSVRRLDGNVLELTYPLAQSLVGEQDVLINSSFVSRMAVREEGRKQTVVTLWLKEGAEFRPEGQGLRLFASRHHNLKYQDGVLMVPKPENFSLAGMDYIFDMQGRKASISFPYPGYLKEMLWIADRYITKVEEKDGRWHFTFPTVHELTVAEDESFLYISARKPKEIFGKVIFIDIGHGGKDTGAIRQGDLGEGLRSYYEKVANFDVAMLLKQKLDQTEGIKVYYSRLDDSNPSMAERVKLANEVDADFLLSLHNNATTVTNRKIQGTDVYYLEGREKNGLSAKQLAQMILKNYAEQTSFKNRLLGNAPDLFMVKYPKMPSVIVETGFMSDPEDLRRIFDRQEQENVAKALYDSILQAVEWVRE